MTRQSDTVIVKKDTNDSALSSMLQKLPDKEKYDLLIQSISSEIMEGSVAANISDFDRIESLYEEMVAKSIQPSPRSSVQLMNAACSYCDCEMIGRAFRIIRRTGGGKSFGSAKTDTIHDDTHV